MSKDLEAPVDETVDETVNETVNEITNEMVDETSDKLSQESPFVLNDERYRQFLNHVHQAMFVLVLAGGIVLGTQFPTQTCYAYISSCFLMWANVYFLIAGIYGVLQKRKSTALVLIGQALFLFGGLFVLMSFFKNELLWVILGCSTWLGALFWAQSIDKIQNPPPEKT